VSLLLEKGADMEATDMEAMDLETMDLEATYQVLVFVMFLLKFSQIIVISFTSLEGHLDLFIVPPERATQRSYRCYWREEQILRRSIGYSLHLKCLIHVPYIYS
jgi:hypothetical protein